MRIIFKKNFYKYIFNYRFNSIFIKNTIMLLLFAILPLILISILSYTYYSLKLQNEIAEKYIQAFNLAENNIASMIDNSSYQAKYINYDNIMENIVTCKDINNLGITNLRKITEKLSQIINTYDYIDSIYIYDKKLGIITSSNVYETNDPSFKNFIDSFQVCRDSKHDYNSFYTFSWRSLIDNSLILTICNPHVSIKNCTTAVMVNINLKNVLNRIGTDFKLQTGTFVLTTEYSGSYIYNENLLSRHEFKVIKKDKAYSIALCNGKKWLQITGNINNGRLKTKYLLPFYQITRPLGYLKIIIYAIIIISSITILFLSFLISYKAYNPIKSILSILDITPDSPKNSNFVAKDELAFIIKTLETTLTENQTSSNELKQKVKLFKNAQFIALQSQINPHFLCNTLDNINWLAILKLNGENEISDMLGTLSKMLRVSLQTSNSFHSIRNEIEHAKQYLSIMGIRYEDKFEVIWSIDEDILDFQTPKLILQPLIENAIYHGIRPVKKMGIIRINISKADNTIQIEVEDNGNGFSEDTLAAFNNNLENEYIKEDINIGIPNVNLRIKILFGENYGITVGNNPAGGARVVVKLPLTEK